MPTIFLTHPDSARRLYYGAEAEAGLAALGTLRRNPHDRPLTPDELVVAAADSDVVVSDRQTPGPAELFDRMPRLVAFVRCAVDVRNVDVAAASRNGILATQASPGFATAVAEWIVGAMIALARGTATYAAAYHAGVPPAPRIGREIRGSVVGIIGYGTIARRLARLLAPFEARILVYDPYVPIAPVGVEPAELPTLLAEADFVVPLAVATAETENLIGGAALLRMKPTAFLVNASRGNLVDEAALEAALDAGRIAGAAMDVGRAADQMPSPHLAARPDVLATPHIGGLTPGAIAHQALETVRQVAAVLKGTAPPGALNADAAHRLARLGNGGPG
ncbi:MAG: hydroxyacid dehydrogenase [Alphaproteobacteria bacterium]|nr:hydroxyacid dehydrogenase [Alphaproteobacteria bacterium]